MAQSLIACPLCSTASFSSTNALCLSLVNVESKRLRCTLCEEELRGLDKLTIHLLGHLIHTDEFKKLLTSENIDGKLTFNSEPLNLVKSQIGQLSQIGCQEKASTDVTVSFRPEISNENGFERSSLKIDDEVMIFFNKNKEAESPTSNITASKLFENTASIEMPKISFDNCNTTNQFENEKGKESLKEVSLSTEVSFNVPTKHQVSHFIFTADPNATASTSSQSVAENLIEMPETEREYDKVFSTEKLKPHNSIEEQNNSEGQCKNSFLSPSGERVVGYRCDICSLIFPDEYILSMHRQLIHVGVDGESSNNKSYKCHLCSKSFVMKGSLMVHMRVAHFGGAVVARLVEAKQLETNAVSPDSAQFICSICNKGFKKEQQLSQHEKLHDGKQCDVCFKTFTTKYFLRKHKRLHTGEMPYTCHICNKSFTFQQSYHKHILYHSDDKPYSCTDCGRSFKELSTLHNHQRIHTGEKPFSCETCGKCFRQRVSYLVHRRIHTGVMPYRCQFCGKTFRYKVSERTHKCPGSLAGSNAVSDALMKVNSQKTNKGTASSEYSEEDKQNQMNIDSTTAVKNGNTGRYGKLPVPSTAVAYQPHAVEEQVNNNSYLEPTDFFSLVMSPSDRLQHLSLSADTEELNYHKERSTHNRMNSEDLKQLLYDVADYNQLQ